MARRFDDASPERSKVRVFYAEAEGTAQSIQDLIRGMTAAIIHAAPAQPARLVAPNNGASGPNGTNGANGVPGGAQTSVTEPDLFNSTVESSMNGDQNGAQTEPPRRKRGEGNNNRDRNTGLSIVKSLDLLQKEKGSLKDFVSKKKPKNQQEHIAVYIYYLKIVAEEPKVNFSHIFTCFKEVGAEMPMDLPQTCRNAANKKAWIDTSDQDDLKTTTAGTNFVEHKLPSAQAAA